MNERGLIAKILYGGGMFFDIGKWLILIVIVLAIINSFWISIFIVDGISMEPNLHDNELALMNKTHYRKEEPPVRGEVVVLSYPGDPKGKRYVKRVIGLPGETLTIKNNKIYINNEVLKEPYLSNELELGKNESWMLGVSQFFVMGDNRQFSNDSRVFGVVEQRFFIGEVTNVLVPRFIAIEIPNYVNILVSGS